MKRDFLWKIILGYIFLRPFVSELAFSYLDFVLQAVFLLASLIYLSKEQFKYTGLDKFISLFFFSIILSTSASTNVIRSIRQIYNYLSLIVLFYLAERLDEEKQRQLILTLLISAISISLYSLRAYFLVSRSALEYLTRHRIWEPFAREFLTRKRAFSPFVSPGLLANYLVMIIMFSLGVSIERIKKNKKGFLLFVSLIGLCLSIFVLLLTQSLGGWLTFLVSICVFSLAAKRVNPAPLWRRVNKKILLTISAIILLILIIALLRTQGNKEFTKPSFSFQRRLSYWTETAEIIRQHPLTGIGIGNLSLKETRFAHNSYLQVWAETGILGIISWLGIIFLFLKKSLQNLKSSRERFFWLGILTSGFAFLFHNIIDFSFFIPQVSFLWWIFLGLKQRAEAHSP